MQKTRYRIAPLLMALGLWLIGNALLGVGSVKGDNIEAYNTGVCESNPVPVAYSNCTLNRDGTCSGSCFGFIRHDTVCDRTFSGGSTPCQTASGTVSQQSYTSACQSYENTHGVIMCECAVGQPAGPPYAATGNQCVYTA